MEEQGTIAWHTFENMVVALVPPVIILCPLVCEGPQDPCLTGCGWPLPNFCSWCNTATKTSPTTNFCSIWRRIRGLLLHRGSGAVNVSVSSRYYATLQSTFSNLRGCPGNEATWAARVEGYLRTNIPYNLSPLMLKITFVLWLLLPEINSVDGGATLKISHLYHVACTPGHSTALHKRARTNCCPRTSWRDMIWEERRTKCAAVPPCMTSWCASFHSRMNRVFQLGFHSLALAKLPILDVISKHFLNSSISRTHLTGSSIVLGGVHARDAATRREEPQHRQQQQRQQQQQQ